MSCPSSRHDHLILDDILSGDDDWITDIRPAETPFIHQAHRLSPCTVRYEWISLPQPYRTVAKALGVSEPARKLFERLCTDSDGVLEYTDDRGHTVTRYPWRNG